MRRPWSKFYWADWRNDPRLRMCGLAARGLWVEMLALMHQAEPYGHLLVNGNVPTNDELALLAGAPSSQIPELLGELERVGVFSRTRKGVIYSRRMLRDEKKAATSRENGKTGGNPTLCKESDSGPWDNPQDNGEVKAQKPDAISQKTIIDLSEREFADWYSGYPRREGRGQALKAYRAARKRATAEQLVAGRNRYAEVCRGKDPQFIRLPATWLNGEGWLDERLPPAQQDRRKNIGFC